MRQAWTSMTMPDLLAHEIVTDFKEWLEQETESIAEAIAILED